MLLKLIWQGTIVLSGLSILGLLGLYIRRLIIQRIENNLARRRETLKKAVVDYISVATPQSWPHDLKSATDQRIVLGIASELLQSLSGTMRTRILTLLNTVINIDRMVKMLRKGSDADRAKVAARLYWSQDPTVHAELRRALYDPLPDVILAAANALIAAGQHIEIEDIFAILKARSMLDHRGARDLLRRLAPANLPALAAMIGSEDADLSVLAIDSVGAVQDEAVFAALQKVARKSRDTDVRAAAVRALGNYGDARAADAIAYALDDISWEVRAQAAIATGRLKLQALIPRLVECLDSDSWWLQWRAAQALAKLGPVGERHLRQVPFDSPIATLADVALAEVHNS